jgi:signal transduction histidine kinase
MSESPITTEDVLEAFLKRHAAFEQAVFTNCGKAEPQEVPVKPGKKLTRVPFTASRLMEFCTRREFVNQTGHDEQEWPLVVLKELVDNAIDAAEESEIAPIVSIAVNGHSITVTDNGPGIPVKTIEGVIDYSIRPVQR